MKQPVGLLSGGQRQALTLLMATLVTPKLDVYKRQAQRMTAAVLVFACAFTMVHIGIGKFGQWHTDSDLVEQDTNCLLYTSSRCWPVSLPS